MDVYRGADKVAELGSYDELRVGANKPAFIYEGAELVYPVPVRDGLVLWYDFSGRTNTDSQRGVAQDLSGNGNNGTLNNFSYADGSGYQNGGLKFDGVDDDILEQNSATREIYTLEVVCKINEGISAWGGIVGNYKHNTPRSGMNISSYILNGSYYIRGVYATENKEQVYLTAPVSNPNDKIHVSLVADGNYEKLYINGVLIQEASSGYNVLDDSPGNFSLGVWSSYPQYRMNGSIQTVKAYNRPLTAEEIQHNYQIEKERFNL